MKNRIRYVCLFLGFLLVGCTFLSRRVEKNMMTQVVAVSPMRYDMLLPMTALQDGTLYYLEEGLGWNTGIRATQISDFYYEFTDKGQILLDGFKEERVVVSASRNLQPGDPVNPLQERETGQDRYLVIYPNGVPEKLRLPDAATPVKQAEGSLLLEIQEAALPFLEQEAKTELQGIQGRQWRIYSRRDLDALAESLPRLAFAAVFAAVPLVMFLFGAILPPERTDKGRVLWFHAVVGIVGMAGFISLIYSVHLPYSLVPEDMIFRWEHYAEHLRWALDAFAQLDENSFGAVLTQCRNLALWIIGAGGVLLAALTAVTLWLCKDKTA